VQDSASSAVLVLTITALADKTFRTHINEKNPLKPRYEVQHVLPETLPTVDFDVKDDTGATLTLGVGGTHSVVVTYATFQIDYFVGEDLATTFNSRGLMNFEHLRAKTEEEDKDGMWSETWKTHADSKPNGPTSVAIDVTFPGAEHVYGIPEHADSLSLKTTKGTTDPYRLYNLDVFEYELDNPMALYGSIPFMTAHRPKQTTGVFLLNAAEMWIDVEKSNTGNGFTGMLRRLQEVVGGGAGQVPQTDTHWIAESGVIDMFVMLGSGPTDVFRQYAELTGMPAMPPLFALAYHQCRWNYNDEADVDQVSERLDEANFPVDVIWLDIEHTDGKRYFTWDSSKFPTPKDMQNKVALKGRKMVNIVDPHIKVAGGYRIHEDAKALGHFVKNKDGNDYEGWCWPGSSSWIDFMDPKIQDWWSDQFAFDKYEGTTPAMFFWNDMNEPSVFNGPEVTMHKDNLHADGWEHRDVHNIYGMWQQAATAVGETRRSDGGMDRPFVLSRAFFAGSQKYGAIWTGDNKADWGHLKASVPMLLSISMAGLPFAGADMGGFFGNPETELLQRWYQAGAFQPFMRAHAHLDTKRREPYLFEGEQLDVFRSAVETRYTYLSFWYTLFFEASSSGVPVMRPLWVQYPDDAETFAIETNHMVGADLLVAPATEAGATSVNTYFPGSEPWYDIESGQVHKAAGWKLVAAPLRKIPVFQRGGSIVPRKMRLRRASALMHHDPFTFDVALDSQFGATGSVFVDDYQTYAYAKDSNKFAYFKLAFTKASATTYTFTAKQEQGGAYATREWVERINVVGFPFKPAAITTEGGAAVAFDYAAASRSLTIKKPSATLADFAITITL